MQYSTDHIRYLSRDFLDDAGVVDLGDVESVPVDGELGEIVAVRSVPRRVDEDGMEGTTPHGPMTDVLTGLWGLGSSMAFVVTGRPTDVSLYAATFRHAGTDQPRRPAGAAPESSLTALLRGAYPGIDVADAAGRLSDLRSFLGGLDHAAMLTGTPAVPGRSEADDRERDPAGDLGVDRLIRSLYGTTWAYVAVAAPVPPTELGDASDATLNERRQVANARQSATSSRPSAEVPIAARYDQLLEEFGDELDEGRAVGAWYAVGYLLADEAATVERAEAAAKAVFSGGASKLDPVRVLDVDDPEGCIPGFGLPAARPPDAPGQIQYPYRYPSVVSSTELAALAHMPTREASGFFVRPQPRFDVTSHHDARWQGPDSGPAPDTEPSDGTEEGLSVGRILDEGRPTGRHYVTRPDALRRHALVAGTTGSGKTNTVFHLLSQLADRDVPFLVVEPAKTEYRSLLETELGDRLRVFTLGDETTAPFRLNPFEVRPGVPVQTHVDHLKSVFNASFVLYAPMPYVLEQCIHEVYEDKGWDLVTDENPRGRHPRAHPTLTDLYEKVDPVVERLGYDTELSQDITAALKTRVDNLRIGSKGLMLDTHASLPVSTLLEQPTVLELDHVGDDDEKAFVIGLVLMSLYEHYRAAGHREDESLRHVTVVEEAHRLLAETTRGDDVESANMAGKAVEAFANVLAEIRAYGEGVVVAEQIPTKLATDVRKNTNLKIAHRLVDEEDRSTMAAAMTADDEQARWLGTFDTGEAAVFGGRDDHPIRVQVPYRKVETDGTSRDLDAVVQERMAAFQDDHAEHFEEYPWAPVATETVRRHRTAVRPVVESGAFEDALARYVLSTAVTADAAFEALPELVRTVRSLVDGDVDGDLLAVAVVRGVDRLFETRGRQSGASYVALQGLKRAFCSLVFDHVLADADPTSDRWPEPDDEATEAWESFRAAFERHVASGTCACVGASWNADDACPYRYDVARLLDDPDLVEPFTGLAPEESDEEFWSRLAEPARRAADRVLSETVPDRARLRAALCFAGQVAEAEQAFDRDAGKELMRGLFRYFASDDTPMEVGTRD